MPKKVFLKKRLSPAKRKQENFFAFRVGAAAVALAVCFVFSAFIQNSLAQSWSEPTDTPPGGNVAAPIWNQNSSAQTGSLYVTGSARFDASDYGNSYCTSSKICGADAGATWALVGESNSGYGLYASSVSSYGLYAASASNYAGYFNGAVYVNGGLNTTGTIQQNGHAVCLSDGTNCLSSGGDSFWTASGNNIYNNNSGKVGIGTPSPNNTIQVANLINFDPTLQNSYLGASAGAANTDGHDNVGVGHIALFANTTGAYNTAIGSNTLQTNSIGEGNTATGYWAMRNNSTGSYNNAYGAFAMSALEITGTANNAFGDVALYSLTSGSFNTAVGNGALSSNTTADNNVAMGYFALYANSIGASNTAMGTFALYFNSEGNNNTAHGFDALYYNTTGSYNTATGASALSQNTASSNSAFGYYALNANTIGTNNTAIGYQAGYNSGVALKTISNSTFLGYGANSSVDGITNSMALGNGAQVTKDNQVMIGNGSVTETVLHGTVVSQAKPYLAWSVAAPTGTADTTGKMMGLNYGVARITPVSSGTIQIAVTAVAASTGASTLGAQLRYGTGTAPVNGAALAGTAVGSLKTIGLTSSSDKPGVVLTWVVSGLTLGAPYWIDVGLKSGSGSYTASLADADVVVTEL